MEDLLAVYLHDHLAGSKFAIELLEKLKAEFPMSETGRMAREVLPGIEEDRRTLEKIIVKVGEISFNVYDAVGWLAERVSRIKLKHDDPQGIGAFEAFETLALGILGKRALWQTLSVREKEDDRVLGPDYAVLLERAQEQFEKVNEYRLDLARTAFLQPIAGTSRVEHR